MAGPANDKQATRWRPVPVDARWWLGSTGIRSVPNWLMCLACPCWRLSWSQSAWARSSSRRFGGGVGWTPRIHRGRAT